MRKNNFTVSEKCIIREELSETEHVAINHWTLMNNESYKTVKIHFIHKIWILRTRVLLTLNVNGSQTTETIDVTLEVTKTEWSLPDRIAVSDNAANEIKALNHWVGPIFNAWGITSTSVSGPVSSDGQTDEQVKSCRFLISPPPICSGCARD